MNFSFYIALFVAFIDYMGIGLIYPLFSSMLFDSSLTFLPASTSSQTRGALLGILLALMPCAQFFSAPIWGAFSDAKGRKTPLLMSLLIAFLGYLIALGGVVLNSLALLLASRVVIGCASGNMAIVQAAIADLSLPQEKTKNFGLYSMSLGLGFTLGPFFGGFLSSWNYALPFLFASAIIACNLVIAFFLFKETHLTPFPRKLNWTMGLVQLKKAFRFKGVRAILLSSFLHNFAWSYFFEFIPVYLITFFQFSSRDLGLFYGVVGGLYALSTGMLIRPFVKRLKPETLFFAGNCLTALTILTIPFLPSSFWMWPLLFALSFFVAFVTPTSTTVVSNHANAQVQGEALGILSSVNAAALVLSPLFAGYIVGNQPALSMDIGGGIMLLAALIVVAVFRSRLFRIP